MFDKRSELNDGEVIGESQSKPTRDIVDQDKNERDGQSNDTDIEESDLTTCTVGLQGCKNSSPMLSP